MRKSNSERFYWCRGCGKWHDPLKGNNGIHYAMDWPMEEPNERNFEGTARDLQRFQIARELRKQDAVDFETRIDGMLA